MIKKPEKTLMTIYIPIKLKEKYTKLKIPFSKYLEELEEIKEKYFGLIKSMLKCIKEKRGFYPKPEYWEKEARKYGIERD